MRAVTELGGIGYHFIELARHTKLAFPRLTQSKALTKQDVVVWCEEKPSSGIHFVQLDVLSQHPQHGIRSADCFIAFATAIDRDIKNRASGILF